MNLHAYQMDALIQRGALAAKRRFPGKQMIYGREAKVKKSTANRHLNGDPHSPMTHYLRGVMIVGWPLIAEAMASLNQLQIKKMSTPQIIALLDKLDEQEHALESVESLCTQRATKSDATPDQLEAAADADIAEAEKQIERAALRRELAERKRRGVA